MCREDMSVEEYRQMLNGNVQKHLTKKAITTTKTTLN